MRSSKNRESFAWRFVAAIVLASVSSGCANTSEKLRGTLDSATGIFTRGESRPSPSAATSEFRDIYPTLLEPFLMGGVFGMQGANWYADTITSTEEMLTIYEPAIRADGPQMTLAEMRTLRNAYPAIWKLMNVAYLPRLGDVALMARAIAPRVAEDAEIVAAANETEVRGHALARAVRLHPDQAKTLDDDVVRLRERLNVKAKQAVNGDAGAQRALSELANRILPTEVGVAASAASDALIRLQHLVRLRVGKLKNALDVFWFLRGPSLQDSLNAATQRRAQRGASVVAMVGCFDLEAGGTWDASEMDRHRAVCPAGGSRRESATAPPGRIPIDDQRTVLGAYKGYFACAPDRLLELVLAESTDDGETQFVKGRLRAVLTAGDPHLLQLDARITGQVRADSGVLLLQPQTVWIHDGRQGGQAGFPTRGAIDLGAPSDSNTSRRVYMELARSRDGSELAGTLSEDWHDCHEVHFRRIDGKRLDSLPPVSPARAFGLSRMSRDFMRGEDAWPGQGRASLSEAAMGVGARPAGAAAGVPRDFNGGYWLRLALELGSSDAKLATALMLSRGVGLEKDEPKAVSLLRELAAQDDARGQIELSKLLLAGRGTPRNEPEAKRLAAAGQASIRAALGVCTSGPGETAIWKLVEAQMKNPNRDAVQNLVGALTDIDFDVGGFLVESIRAESIANVRRPFQCVARGRMSEASVMDVTPLKETTVYNRHGVVLYKYDNSFDRAAGRAASQWLTQALRRTPVDLYFNVFPMSATRFRFVLMGSGFLDIGPRYQVDIDLALAQLGAR